MSWWKSSFIKLLVRMYFENYKTLYKSYSSGKNLQIISLIPKWSRSSWGRRGKVFLRRRQGN